MADWFMVLSVASDGGAEMWRNSHRAVLILS